MTVFEPAGLRRISSKLDEKFRAMLSLQPCELTPQDFLQAFVAPEDRAVVVRAWELLGSPSDNFGAGAVISFNGGGELSIAITLKQPGFMLPIYMRPLKITNTYDVEAAAKVIAWFNELHDLVGQIVALKACISYVNSQCQDALQINAYLPALAKFMRGKEDDDKAIPRYNHTFQNQGEVGDQFTRFSRVRKRLVSGKVAKSLPCIPREVVNLCRDANTLLLRCALTIEADEAPGGNVHGSVNLGSSARIPELFGGVPMRADTISTFVRLRDNDIPVEGDGE